MTKSPIRIAVLHFSHETVTFLRNDTTVDDFVYPGSPARGEALLASGPKSYMGGFVQVAREYDGVELVGIESPLWPKTGSGSGWVTQGAYETLVGRMIAQIEAEGPFDGVYLCIHGAMAARGIARPEAELARRVRRAWARTPASPRPSIHMATRTRSSCAMPTWRSAASISRITTAISRASAPHARMVRAIRGAYRPAHATVKVPIISPTVVQWTGASPWMDLVQRALTWEAREPDAYVNVYFGFPWSDVPDVGMTVQVITNDDATLAQLIAGDMAQFAWRRREALLHSTKVHTIPDGVALARQAVEAGAAPVVLADHSDRSGYATWLLREIIAQGLCNTLIATVADAGVIAALKDAKPGDAFDMAVGGLADESAGEPVRIAGTVLHAIERWGQLWVSVGFGQGNVLVISPYLAQIIEPSTLREIGIDPNAFDVIAIKSRVHFRRGFDDSGFARTILLVEPTEPFLGTVRLDGLKYQNVELGKLLTPPWSVAERVAVRRAQI